MIRHGNCNFATDGALVQLVHADKPHLVGSHMAISGDGQSAAIGNVGGEDLAPNSLWWHSLFEPMFRGDWPVCWPKDKPMALWFNRDGWGAVPSDMCVKAGKDGWTWAFNDISPFGGDMAYFQPGNEPGNRESITLDEAYGKGRDDYAYVRIGGQYVLVWGTQNRPYDEYQTNWEYHNNFHKTGETWCGYNLKTPGPFVILDRSQAAPDPVDASQVYYKISCRCTRLLLVQNAMLTGNETIDFSKARVRVLLHIGTKQSLSGVNRKNGERPLFYERGAGRTREIEVDDDFHFPPIDNAADPRTDDAGTYLSPVYAPITGERGISLPYRKGDGDWPNTWPAFIKMTGERATHTENWNAEPLGDLKDVEKAKKALEDSVNLVKALFWKEVSYPPYSVSPVPERTAFDMVLAVRTYKWRKFQAEIKTKEKTDKNGKVWTLNRGSWKNTHEVGYFNSKVAGWLYQLAPAKAKGA